MIKELRVHNFRTLINLSLQLTRKHLFIGKNNSGKTNLGHALTFPRLVAQNTIDEAIAVNPGGAWDFCNYAIASKDRTSKFLVHCAIDFENEPFEYRYELAITVQNPQVARPVKGQSRITTERLTVSGGPFSDTPLITNDGLKARLLDEARFRDKNGDCLLETQPPQDSSMLAKLYEMPTNPVASRFREALKGVAYFNLSADHIRWGWKDGNSAGGGLVSNGANLAPMIYALKTSQESRYRNILETIARIDPRLKAINFLVGPEQNVVPIVELEGGRTASWASLSDGTLRALALIYLFEYAATSTKGPAPGLAPVLIIEEPENNLFVGELRAILDDAEASAPEAQFIFTSHSPYFIDLFDLDLSAVSLFRREDWHTSVTSLESRRKEIEESLKTMSLGEQYFRDMFE